MGFLFYRTDFKGKVDTWDVSNVTDMTNLFDNSTFNGDISLWRTTSLEIIDYMFRGSCFDGDLSSFDVSNVKSAKGTFAGCNFDGDLSNWSFPLLKWDFIASLSTFYKSEYTGKYGDLENFRLPEGTDIDLYTNIVSGSKYTGYIGNGKEKIYIENGNINEEN